MSRSSAAGLARDAGDAGRVSFSREDEQMTVRFALQPPPAPTLAAAAMKPGGNQFAVKAHRHAPAGRPTRRAIRSSSIRTRRAVTCWSRREVTVKALDVEREAEPERRLRDGRRRRSAGRARTARRQALDDHADELAWGDLSKYNVIMTGVRAYERRTDLRAYNQRLLDYAKAGGTVIVQYNKFEFNDAQYGPFPARSDASASPTRTPK